MQIEFDPAKDAANQLKHGLSLGAAARIDFDTAVYRIDDRFNYGEVRSQAIGYLGDRKANQKEAHYYDREAAAAAGLRRKPGMD